MEDSSTIAAEQTLHETAEEDFGDSNNLVKHHPNICQPISELAHVWAYIQNPPTWINRIIDLVPRSPFVVKNHSSDCHAESDKFIPQSRLGRNTVPRTLICHDMKGGYLEDKYVGAINIGNGYTFYRWAQIDIFVYFTHHLITIPPCSWINLAHSNGVRILGTFITEWTSGKEICEQIFIDMKTMQTFAMVLVDICILFKMDGWLLNIENSVEDAGILQEFVKYLTKQLHRKKPESLVIWYDSVTKNGELKWQNELNNLNRCYLDLCDGIFLNYTWNEKNLENTVKAAEHRLLDVYVGVDVFGRNSYGGGNFNSYLAAEKIRQYNLSMAIFAQGWTHETLTPQPVDTVLERFLNRDNAFWRSLWSFLYTHPITTMFHTFFYTGVDKEWYKLDNQQVQLSKFLHSKNGQPEDLKVSPLIGTCNCLQLHFNDAHTSCLITSEKLDSGKSYVHHLFSCDIPVNRNIVYSYTKNVNPSTEHSSLSLILLIEEVNGTFRKVICHSKGRSTEQRKDNTSIVEISPSKNWDVISMVSYQQSVPKDWILRCYLLSFKNSRILEIGAKVEDGHTICLCGIGIRNASIL